MTYPHMSILVYAETGSHDSKCECCQVTRYEPITVTLSCQDGSTQAHKVASPVACGCQRCGEAQSLYPPQGTSILFISTCIPTYSRFKCQTIAVFQHGTFLRIPENSCYLFLLLLFLFSLQETNDSFKILIRIP